MALALSAVSLIVMPVLVHLKGRTGREMGSRALVADPAAALAMLPGILW